MEPAFDSTLSPEEYNFLRTSVGWRALSDRQVQNIFQYSACITILRIEGKALGMARVLTDFGNNYFIADVIVLPEQQGKGYGRMLLTKVMEYIKSSVNPHETIQINLMAENGMEAFYEKFSFKRRPNETSGYGMTLWYTK